jgi:hypothetical protein
MLQSERTGSALWRSFRERLNVLLRTGAREMFPSLWVWMTIENSCSMALRFAELNSGTLTTAGRGATRKRVTMLLHMTSRHRARRPDSECRNRHRLNQLYRGRLSCSSSKRSLPDCRRLFQSKNADCWRGKEGLELGATSRSSPGRSRR